MAAEQLRGSLPQAAIEEIVRNGWVELRCAQLAHGGPEFNELRSTAAGEFARLARSGVFERQVEEAHGQRGFTADANEGEVGLEEARSHYVDNLRVPEDHPLRLYSPHFYGEDGESPPALASLSLLALRLHEFLDRLTMMVLESLELELELGYGALAGPVAMGERLLRFQWYPEIEGGVGEVFPVDTPDGPIPVAGVRREGRRIVRASPHRDMGHWTWQVFATDEALRFWHDSRRAPVPAGGEESLYGNVCEFLSSDCATLPAPVHWVDLLEPSRDRVSVSYFAHARPATGVPLNGRLLYERLADLGYVEPEAPDGIEALLSRAAATDERVVLRMLESEGDASSPPRGFALGVARYYEVDPTGRATIRTGPP